MAALTAALIGLTAASTAMQYSAAKSAGDYQQSVANVNADLDDLSAGDAIARGDKAAGAQHKKTKQLIGAQRAALGASGAAVNSGSAADLTADSKTLGALDALTIKSNAAREAFGYKVQGLNSRASGQFAHMESRAKMNSTLLTGGIQAIGAYKNRGSDFWQG